MNSLELLESLTFLFEPNQQIGIELYFVIDDNNAIRRADISDDVAEELQERFTNYISTRIFSNADLLLAPISEGETVGAIYHYNFEEWPASLQPMLDVTTNAADQVQDFSFGADDFKKIKGFLIKIGNEGNEIVLYKKHYPISLMERDSRLLGLIESDHRFEKLDSNIVRLNDTFEFMKVGDELVVLSLNVFEKHFGYDAIIKQKAVDTLQIVQAANLLADIQVLQDLANELKYAKRIMKIKRDSPVLQIPVSDYQRVY